VPVRARNIRASVVVVVLADVVALELAALLDGSARRGLALYAAVWFATLALSGAYVITLHLSLLEQAPRLVLRASFAFLAGMAIGHLADITRPPVVGVLIALIASLVLRAIVYAAIRWARVRGLIRRPTLVVGGGFVGLDVMSVLRDHPEYGLEPVGFIDNAPSVGDAPALGALCDLDGILREYAVRDIIVAYGTAREADLVHLLRTAAMVNVEVHVVPRFFDIGLVPNSPRIDQVWGIPLVRVRRSALRLRAWSFKRLMDIVVSGSVLLVLSPLLGLIALLVKLSSPGPVFYRQSRIGQGHKPIDVLKFRSLRMEDPADEIDRSALSAEEIQAHLASTVAARQTAIGRFLRKTSLDELPQLINVLRGEMSLVGPRPEQPPYVSEYESTIYGYSARHRLPVGLTGLAQVNGLRGDSSIRERARFDNYYIENWTPWLDTVVALRTVGAVLRELRSSDDEPSKTGADR
jgi:exopolysaccharide biosynthesis polyprenyl glycosylphosphotransferase